MPNLKNHSVRRRTWKKYIKALEIGPAVERTKREFDRNHAFAVYKYNQQSDEKKRQTPKAPSMLVH